MGRDDPHVPVAGESKDAGAVVGRDDPHDIAEVAAALGIDDHRQVAGFASHGLLLAHVRTRVAQGASLLP